MFHLNLGLEDRLAMATSNIRNIFRAVSYQQCKFFVVAAGDALEVFTNGKIGSHIKDIGGMRKLGVVLREVCYALMALRRRLIICSELAIVACFRDSIILPSASCSNAP